MGYKIRIILITILISETIFALVQEDSIQQKDYGYVEIQEDQIVFNPSFEDHLKIVGYVWKKNPSDPSIPATGIFPVESKEEFMSKHVYVGDRNQIYLVRIYRYKIQDEFLDVFLQDKSLQIFYSISCETGVYKFLANKLISLDNTRQIQFLPKRCFLNVNQNVGIDNLSKTLLNTLQQILPNQLVIHTSLTGVNTYDLKIMMSTIILNNIEFNLDTALLLTSFKGLSNLQIIQCTTQTPDSFIAILYLIKKLSKLNLSKSVEVPDIFLKHIVSILQNRSFEFIPHNEKQFLQYVRENNNFELFEKIVFRLDTDSAKSFLINTMISESNFNLDSLEQIIIAAETMQSHLLINRAALAFFEAVWKHYYPTTFIINRIINLFNNHRYYLQHIDNIKRYLSFIYYERPIINKELIRNFVESMAMSDWDTMGNASYLLYKIDHESGQKESSMKNLADACNKNNVLALYTSAKMTRDEGLFEQPDSEEKDLICKKIKDTFCTDSVILTCRAYELRDIIEYIQEYSQLIDNYLLSRDLV